MECKSYGDLCPLCLGDETLCEGCDLPSSDCECGSLCSETRCYKCGGAGVLFHFEKTAGEVAKLIKWDYTLWEGNCHGVACALLKHRIVEGKVRYGHWKGPVDPRCKMFYGKPILYHGWIELPDGKIVDPTRWIFEGADPYIYYGDDEDKYYDIGGQEVQRNLRSGAPAFDPEDGGVDILFPAGALEVLGEVMETGPYFTQKQVHWIAHLTPEEMGEHGKAIYQSIVDAGFGVFIPMDLRKLVLEG